MEADLEAKRLAVGFRQRPKLLFHLLLDAFDGLLGLIFLAVGHEPARALGDKAAYENDDDAKSGSHEKGQPPAEIGRNQVCVEQEDGGCRPASCAQPVGGVDEEIDLAPDARGYKLVYGRINGRVFAADTHAGNAAEDRVAPEVPAERAACRGYEIDEQGNGEEFLAAKAIGRIAEENSTHDRAEQVGSRAFSDLCISHVQAGFEDAADGPGECDFEPVENPRDAEPGDHQPVPLAPGQSVHARRDVSFNNVAFALFWFWHPAPPAALVVPDLRLESSGDCAVACLKENLLECIDGHSVGIYSGQNGGRHAGGCESRKSVSG